MNIDKRSESEKFKKTVLAMGLGIILSLGGGVPNAAASGVPVVDSLLNARTVASFMETVKQWGVEGQQWLQHYEMLRRNLVQLQRIVDNLGLPSTFKFEEIQLNSGIADKCGYGLSLSVSSITSLFGGSSSSNPKEQAKMLCASIQYMKNAKYNYQVKLINESMPSINSSLNSVLSGITGDISSPGVNSGLQTSLMNANNILNSTIARSNAGVQSYDAAISALEGQQKLLTEQMFRGKASLLGSAVSTVALDRALND